MLKNRIVISCISSCMLLVCIACAHQSVSTDNEPKFYVLPDGSKVVLNQNSTMTYVIDEDKREVHLDGGAFFKVVKSTIPFKVHTPQGDITVLGTEFAVESSDEGLEVEVDDGEVAVETTAGDQTVRTQERVFYNDAKQLFEHGKAEFKHHIWTDEFKKDMRGLGKEIEKGGKQLGKKIKQVGNDLKIKI
ncbi:FecR domain-containing protein [Carboxylicivirga sediminis]|uniref:FecR domain-containing protein n=1 Tax=Carboxylicivirga sediminis TaxID=2006564 RepID=A0A941IZC3_9BACT|nr:FecR family protein [Carboxylicivirga sediminis]MBR8536562.1 FecR domain-containing protein [Carboxylicivirga sediminis]